MALVNQNDLAQSFYDPVDPVDPVELLDTEG
jgi:hypothetical protein